MMMASITVLPSSSIISFVFVIVVVTLGGLVVLGEEVHERVLALSLRRELAVEAAKEVGVAVHGRVKVGNETRYLKMHQFKLHGFWFCRTFHFLNCKREQIRTTQI